MERYIINCESFKNKEEIRDKCRKIVNSNIGNDLIGTDLEFMIQILKFHPDKEKLFCTKRIFVNIDKYRKNPCCYIQYLTGEIRDVSWTKCILHIPFGEDNKIDWIMPFGKYKGKSLYDIFDEDLQYLHWVTNQTWLDRKLKIKINQMIRYGHIPYNPIANQHDKKKNDDIIEFDETIDYDNIDIYTDYE